MLSHAALLFIWLSGLLAGHLAAVFLNKQEVVDHLLRTYVDICLHGAAEGGVAASIFLQYFGSTCIVVLDFLGSWMEHSLNYMGSSVASTLTFVGSAISETVNFIGSTLSAVLRVSGQVMSCSLDYVGGSASATIIFVLDVMEKLASAKIFYTFLFFLSLYLLWRFPGGLQKIVHNVCQPLQEGVVEVWRTSTRATFLVWSAMKLNEVLKFLLVVTVIVHIKNNLFC